MVIDVCSFNGEFAIWDIRYNVLKDVVDKFIVCEAPLTFSGLDKPLYFDEIRDVYDKVEYHVINEKNPIYWKMAINSPNTIGAEHWKREFVQKEAIHDALKGLNDNDIVFISDCDEIWMPGLEKQVRENIYKVRQLVYTYHLNNRSSEPWAGTFVAKYKNIKGQCLNHLRANANVWLNRPETWGNLLEGGWHFTNMGGIEAIKRKLKASYTEEDYANPIIFNALEKNFRENKDFLEGWQRNFTFWQDESDWPDYLKKNRHRYLEYLKAPSS